jgi:hypothetical protein
MRQKRHNPEEVNSAFIPKGCRLLNPDEIRDTGPYNCALWLAKETYHIKESRWSAFNQKPHYKIWTYIIKK